jgi:hypothetical protein
MVGSGLALGSWLAAIIGVILVLPVLRPMRMPREIVLARVDVFNCQNVQDAAALDDDAMNLQVPNGHPNVRRNATPGAVRTND